MYYQCENELGMSCECVCVSECVYVSVCELWASVWMCESICTCACTHIPVPMQGLALVPDAAVKEGIFSKNHFGSMMGENGVSWDVHSGLGFTVCPCL